MSPTKDDTIGKPKPNVNAHTTNPAFPTKEAAQEYLSSISPPRDLVCPITQELYINPVVASDGHTYEKQAIRTWFDAQQSSRGSIRSPVTNAYIALNAEGMMLVENKAVVGMVQNFQEKLGEELCMRCQAVWDEHAADDDSVSASLIVPYLNSYSLDDKGFRIKGLVEAGADLSIKGCRGGNTAFMSLLQSNVSPQNEKVKYDILNYFMVHKVPVSLQNDKGKNSIELMEELLSRSDPNSSSSSSLGVPYHQLAQQIKQQTKNEIEMKKAQSEARDEYNNEQRERQRVLSDDAQNMDSPNNTLINAHGIGRMEIAWGYFPNLVTLLLQGSVPDPPASFAEEEMREKKRLQFILRSMGFAVVVFFLVC